MTELAAPDRPTAGTSAAPEAPAAGPCPCGSGLTGPRCCALDPRLALETAKAEGYEEQAAAFTGSWTRGDKAAAKAQAIALLEQAPGRRDALTLLFHALRDEGRTDAAAAVVDRLANIHINDPVARVTAAQFFLGRDDMARAQYHARMLVRLAPEAAISHMTMGRAFLVQPNGKAAEHHFRVALALPSPRGPQVQRREIEAHLAIALRHQGRFDEARAIFAGVSEDSRDPALLLAWAALEEAAGDFAAADALLDRVEALAPQHPQLPIARATLLKRTRQPERALATLDAGRAEGAGDGGGANLQKGQILDSMGRYDEAFAAFSAFKAWLRETSGHSYQDERAAALVRELGDFFTPGRTPLLPRATTRDDVPQPVFIVGFPRSGTTLVEQTLTSHPHFAAGDELPVIGQLAERAPMLLGSQLSYPKALSELWLGDRAGLVASLRDLYLNEAARFGAVDPAKRWFTDKMPLNETHLGLIHILFPKSPIVHLVRHPLDVVLSVFSNGLTHGYYCAYALESAATHYARIAELIAAYRAALPLHYHALRYEDLVAEQEREVRALFGFIGEDFDARTLAFHENARPARTASYAQVTEKLYTRSVHRYRHYLKHLEPVIPILMPAIERLGYTVEG
ncbi:sulfotransferase [Sphingomonas sp. H39-1-10]|uniref:tetratricopeptide repeat-containing sulfotransferase family protein n=1 Tax=Sphingomonas pollutisoli TaxID=3030829 RepID=UPI0023B9F8A4|nr:tetratricopeptide repeat-containing sulfotransferase family protein [Sphingomonas pollutisoli]MDF0491403.1 sulfotransferase [Sphingomonas pollutisoli]